MEDVLIFTNPIAGRGMGVVIARQLEHRLVADGYRVQVHIDRAEDLPAGQLPPIARAAIVIGGDGTLRSVTQHLIDANPNSVPPLLPIPLGTANLMGRHLGINWDRRNFAGDVSAAVRARKLVNLDAGRANGRIFLLMVGVGFDAGVVHELDRVRAGPIQFSSYALPMLSVLGSYHYPAIGVWADDREIFPPAPAVAFVGNVAEYGTGFPVLPLARPDDGLLDVCVLPCRSTGDLAHWALLAAAGEHLQSEGAVYVRAKRVSIVSKRATPVQIDGDPAGQTPVIVDLLPFKLPFIVA